MQHSISESAFSCGMIKAETANSIVQQGHGEKGFQGGRWWWG